MDKGRAEWYQVMYQENMDTIRKYEKEVELLQNALKKRTTMFLFIGFNIAAIYLMEFLK